ncbi:MAG: PDZ domain-containing protein [Deltaproteobacteria bacterium]|nr:PDZ domain-containing protein [Deltaproteobacteria bacterium]
MKKEIKYEFCMAQFKPAVAGLAVLVFLVLGWTGWHCTHRAERRADLLFAAVNAPAGLPPIGVKDKMLHPYWGNCNKCHVTIIDAKTPISKVMAGAPISIKANMPHKYWGNCLLCHQVIDGIKPKMRYRAKAAALNRGTAQTVGLKVQTVTAARMQKLGLANEDGVLVLEVTPGSIADKAGLRQGDEIIRVGKVRVETKGGLETALQAIKPGGNVKINIYRGTKHRNLFFGIPRNLTAAAATAPMTQNQVETLAEQLGVPKTQQDVARALQRQKQARAAAATAPMTQNQVETLAEQLGVPKTQQDVARALQRQKQARAAGRGQSRCCKF